MAGTKGKSGGARPNAGRTPTSMTLKTGDFLVFHRVAPDGVTRLEKAKVNVISKAQLELILDNGEKLVIIR